MRCFPQIGTRISGWLGDDADISACFRGWVAKDQLRGMLAHLQPAKRCCLLWVGRSHADSGAHAAL